jgi:hypothetical protein
MSKKILLLLVATGATLGLIAGTRVISREHQALAAENQRLTRLEAQVQAERERRDEARAASESAAESLASLRATAATRAAEEAQQKAWWDRIKPLQQRLNETPSEKIPELKLLGLKDWIDAVFSADTGTEAEIKKVFAGLRNRARLRFAGQLREALDRFTEQSGGELPTHLHALLSYLAPPADEEMLAGYVIKRSGKILGRNEELIVSRPLDQESGIAITLDEHKLRTHPDDITTAGAAIGELSSELTKDRRDLADFADLGNLAAGLPSLGPVFEAAFAPLDKAFGERLKAAVRQFSAANHGKTPSDLSQLRPYFPESDQVAARVRPVIAHLEYLMDHGGTPPAAPAQLQRYLARPVDPAHTLRALKLTVEGEHVTMEFSLKE